MERFWIVSNKRAFIIDLAIFEEKSRKLCTFLLYTFTFPLKLEERQVVQIKRQLIHRLFALFLYDPKLVGFIASSYMKDLSFLIRIAFVIHFLQIFNILLSFLLQIVKRLIDFPILRNLPSNLTQITDESLIFFSEAYITNQILVLEVTIGISHERLEGIVDLFLHLILMAVGVGRVQ